MMRLDDKMKTYVCDYMAVGMWTANRRKFWNKGLCICAPNLSI